MHHGLQLVTNWSIMLFDPVLHWRSLNLQQMEDEGEIYENIGRDLPIIPGKMIFFFNEDEYWFWISFNFEIPGAISLIPL